MAINGENIETGEALRLRMQPSRVRGCVPEAVSAPPAVCGEARRRNVAAYAVKALRLAPALNE